MTCGRWIVLQVISIAKIRDINLINKPNTIEKINNESLPKQQTQSLLEHRGDFWILRLETLSP